MDHYRTTARVPGVGVGQTADGKPGAGVGWTADREPGAGVGQTHSTDEAAEALRSLGDQCHLFLAGAG